MATSYFDKKKKKKQTNKKKPTLYHYLLLVFIIYTLLNLGPIRFDNICIYIKFHNNITSNPIIRNAQKRTLKSLNIIFTSLLKSKITKILNSEENSKQIPILILNCKIKSSKTSNEWIPTIIFLTWYKHFLVKNRHNTDKKITTFRFYLHRILILPLLKTDSYSNGKIKSSNTSNKWIPTIIFPT